MKHAERARALVYAIERRPDRKERIAAVAAALADVEREAMERMRERVLTILAEFHSGCICIDAYKDRELVQPDCRFHDEEDMAEAVRRAFAAGEGE